MNRCIHFLTRCFCVLFVVAFVVPAQANHPGAPSGDGVQPTLVPGNPTCSSVTGGYEFKINDPGDGTFTGGNHPDGTITVTIDVRSTGAGQVFDWSATGGTVENIVVKGGPNANLYHYDPPDTADTGLHSPVNHNNGNYYGLSHISFCYIPGEASIAAAKTCDLQQKVNGDTAITTNTVSITNDGDFTLTSIQIMEQGHADLASCTLTHVTDNGGATTDVADVPLPFGSWVTVPNSGSFNGDLAVGETVGVRVACTADPGVLNVPNTAKARGVHEGENVDSDPATSNPAATCGLGANPSVAIDKTCPPDVDAIRLMAQDNILAVQVCPQIIVTNNGLTDTLTSAVVTDLLIPALSGGVDVGPLAPGASVNLGEDLLLDLCYMPSVAEDSLIEGTDNKYSTSTAYFLNEAVVQASGAFGGQVQAMDGTATFDPETGDLIGDPECPLCPPCPDCE